MQEASIEVLKIGGGILRDKESFGRVIDIVKEKKENNKQIVLVLSALYGVTDYLIGCGKKSLHSEEEIDSFISEIKKMHFDYIEQLENKTVKERAVFELNEKISILEKFLFGVSYLKELSPRSKDLIQSFGERLSPIVLEAYLNDAKIDARFIDAKEAGIIALGNFEKANVDLEKTTLNFTEKVLPELKTKVILLPGYYGIDSNNDVKTFGRGGTDYSAGFIANIFDAKLEIWKDVSGFMSADPRIVKNAMQIDHLNYDEAEELGYLGAKILHPRTMDPLRQKGLNAEIKNLFAPVVKGTIIGKEKSVHQAKIKSIAATKEIAVITVQSSTMVNNPGFSSKIFMALAKEDIEIDLIATSETSVSFTLNPKDLEKAIKNLEELNQFTQLKISVEKDLSLIGVVGNQMRFTPGIAGKLFTALGKNNINIELISQSASELNISFVVKKEDLDKTIQIVHKEFLE